MNELDTRRHCWSWRNCFTAAVKHKKKKSKKQGNCQSSQDKHSSNEQIEYKRVQTVDENSNLLHEFDFTSNEYNHSCIPIDYITKTPISSEEIHGENNEQTIDGVTVKIIHQKSSTTVRSTPLDAIVEDLNEENLDETIQPVRLCCDRELIDDSNDLYTRLSDFSRQKHLVMHLDENGYLLGEFSRHLEKFELKIHDIQRASTEMPRDAELLEARYSTLLATMESLSILLKIAQISSFRSLISRLRISIEERMEQLNKLVQLSSSINLRHQRQELNDDDFLSFRSAFSSYEHLLTISS